MAKLTKQFVCQSCGTVYGKWAGQCDACGEWNSIVEEVPQAPTPGGLAKGGTHKGRAIHLTDLQGESTELPRYISGIGEFDRATGGGLVPGSAVLVGGDPGIGKSTILLQAVSKLAAKKVPTLYISGEEATAQVQMRARRLGLETSPVHLGAETNLRDILATLEAIPNLAVAVIDSIQTVYADSLESAPGTVAQVRACSQELIRFAKRSGVVVIIVGHVTKDGQIAGPRVLEHMVDTVLYFEGERGHQFRILRAVKNRFGGTDEIGVFEMTDLGLQEVPNPSAMFLGSRKSDVSGAAVFAGMEGTRPVLMEIQALVAPSMLGTPRRAVVGWDSGRLAMIMAVLDARCGLGLGGHDVYLNVAGGLKVTEPAADLAVAAALLSSLSGKPLSSDTVVFGEISLSGEIRAVTHAAQRLKEAEKLGFSRAILPANLKGVTSDVDRSTVEHIQDLADRIMTKD
ncbi:DNA repair protein RadA [Govanella unica]|uniref:DNA repair protein RadA n=1 Tax=Govanella unica TaxID=2975056 RepID=A0A9X3TZ27_9PROT|nr:DNA repair protein RadA [Govania unica]MDA5194337.1 DNA repair protein RadA [Govania unica]